MAFKRFVSCMRSAKRILVRCVSCAGVVKRRRDGEGRDGESGEMGREEEGWGERRDWERGGMGREEGWGELRDGYRESMGRHDGWGERRDGEREGGIGG